MASRIAFSILKGTSCRSPEFMRSVLITHIRPTLDFSSTVWHTGYLTDYRLLERVQRRWTKRISGFQHLNYKDRLLTLNLFSIKGRLIRLDLIQVWKVVHGHSPSLSHLFQYPPANVTRGHNFKLFVPRALSDIRTRFFSVRVVPLWNSLPDRIVSAATLSSFKRLLVEVLGDTLFQYDD